MKSEIEGMYITEEDKRFFHYLHAVKVATYKQIKRDVYPAYQEESVANRIRKMEDNKLVKGNQSRTVSYGRRIVMLAKKGFNLFLENGEEMRTELKSGSIQHDLSLVDIRHKLLKQQRAKRYLTENVLQTWGDTLFEGRYSHLLDLKSDALIEVEAPKGLLKVPVEYESVQKSATRYVDIVDKYYRKPDIQIVVFIYKESRIMKQIQKVEKKKVGQGRPKFFYAWETDVLEAEVPYFLNFRGDQLHL